MGLPQPNDNAKSNNTSGDRLKLMKRLIRACISFAVLYYIFETIGSGHLSFPLVNFPSPNIQARKDTCHPPPLNLLAYYPPSANDKDILKAAQRLDRVLTRRVSKFDSGIDSLSVAVVTANGPIFERGYGVLRANESSRAGQYPVDRDSIFRIASVTKMITVLETLILRERGALNWDDPVEKYLPEFSVPGYGWAGYLNGLVQNDEEPRVALRQLASHLGGIGREPPTVDVGDWPTHTPWPELSPETDHFSPTYPDRSYQSIMKALSEQPLVNMPYQYPVYSSVGIALLGLSNIAANKMANPNNGMEEPETHKELVKRDIFDPLNMNSSFYRVPNSPLREHIVVPSKSSEWTDQDLTDIGDPTGGQYSSVADLGKLMKSFLSPTTGGILPPRVIREWLHPLYVWGSSNQQTGAPWEIMDYNGVQAYTKGGNLPGYHSEFVLIPGSSYGVIVLLAGTFADSREIAIETANYFQPVFEKTLETRLKREYVGNWINGADIAQVNLVDGHLYLTKLFVRGVDVLQFLQDQDTLVRKAAPVALWTTGRTGEFRLAIGRRSLNNIPEIGCIPYWVSIDPGLSARGAPLDLIYWENGVLHYPSAGVIFTRLRDRLLDN